MATKHHSKDPYASALENTPARSKVVNKGSKRDASSVPGKMNINSLLAEVSERPRIVQLRRDVLSRTQQTASVKTPQVLALKRKTPTRFWISSAAISAMAAAVMALWLLIPSHPIYQTEKGATLSLSLEDGSLLHLDTDSKVEVKYRDEQREIALVQGRALFDVAHDASRPFIVTHGDTRVTALGTVFSVDRRSQKLAVFLEEGKVRVDIEGDGTQHTQELSPGHLLTQDLGIGTAQVETRDAANMMSWSNGSIVFKATPLSEVLDELNRYNEVQFRVQDQDLALIKIDAVYRIGETKAFLNALKTLLNMEVFYDEDGNGDIHRRDY